VQRREDAAFARLQSIALFGDSSSILNPYASQSLEIRRVVGTQEIQPLPIGGRNFVDFVKFSSGVAPGRENVGGGPFKKPDAGVGPAAVPRQSFGGQTGSIRWYRSMNSITRKPSPACLAPRPPSKRPASFVWSTAAASLRTDGRTGVGRLRQHRHAVRRQRELRLPLLLRQNRALNAWPILGPAIRPCVKTLRPYAGRTDKALRATRHPAVLRLLHGSDPSKAESYMVTNTTKRARDAVRSVHGTGPKTALEAFKPLVEAVRRLDPQAAGTRD